MTELNEQKLRDIIRSEIEAFLLQSPQWVTERMSHELSTAIAKKLNEQTVEEVTKLLIERLEKKLSEAVLAKLAETVDKAYVQAVSGSFTNEFVAVYQELDRLRKTIAESERDNWWRRGEGPESEHGHSP